MASSAGIGNDFLFGLFGMKPPAPAGQAANSNHPLAGTTAMGVDMTPFVRPEPTPQAVPAVAQSPFGVASGLRAPQAGFGSRKGPSMNTGSNMQGNLLASLFGLGGMGGGFGFNPMGQMRHNPFAGGFLRSLFGF